MGSAGRSGDVASVFDAWARGGRAEGMEQHHARAARRAFERLALPPDGWFLDVGCGNGYAVRWAARLVPEGRAVGIDAAAEMIELARRASRGFDNVEFVRTTLPESGLPADRFDAALSMEALYYLPPDGLAEALVELRGLLKPGASFACVVNYYAENAASHGWPDDVGLAMNLMDAPGWRNALRLAGFDVVAQERLRAAPEEARSDWEVSEGSLMTLARRPQEADSPEARMSKRTGTSKTVRRPGARSRKRSA